jgi:hypothetical protein
MLVESWNGTKWAIKKTFSPSGAESSQLSGVSCASATACTAVGMYINSSRTQVTLAEAWNGKSWSTKKSPNPTGAESSQLSGVSCASATACTAVGMYFNSSGSATLAETWNGKSWAIKKSTNPAGGQFLELSAVSCASVTACTAVGSYFNSSGSVTLAEAWNGKNWATQTTPDPSGSTGSELSGVSCTTSACIAAGSTRYDVGVGVPLVESST